ncbi:MAG: cytidine deaminase [Gemella sp.]|nr:cytidine deaminase [Gemella sp.]
MSNEELVQAAIEATKNAYVPYSNFYVGAALVTKDGTVFTGCNIENASFTPTNCAERTAIFKAVSEGHREIAKIAVVGGPNRNLENYCPPCGVCRQVIAEFADENCQLIMGKSNGEFQVFDFYEEILPNSFTKSKLN